MSVSSCSQRGALHVQQVEDLVILTPLLRYMANMEVTDDPTDEQVQAYSGGPLLRVHGGTFLSGDISKVAIQRVSALWLCGPSFRSVFVCVSCSGGLHLIQDTASVHPSGADSWIVLLS